MLSMKRKILAGMVVVLCMVTVVVPVVNAEDSDNFLDYINKREDISEHSGKIYHNVLILGVGHNQIEIDATYKQPNGKWRIDGVEFDLVIAPYSGNKWKDYPAAASEVCGMPVVSDKAFEPYKGALFENVITYSGGGPALRNQRRFGNIKTRPGHVTFLGDPDSHSSHEHGDKYVANPKDPVAHLSPSLIRINENTPGFGARIDFPWPGDSSLEPSVKKGPGTGHTPLKEYSLADYAPAEFVVGGVDEGPETGLGGIDFTSIQLNYISTSTYSDPTGQIQSFNFALKAKKAENSDKIIDIEDATELALNSFFIGVTLPESKFWVNLNPWEPDVITDEDLRNTDMGRIMLEADLRMKRDFCKYENPCESEIGEEYWKLLNKKSEELAEECMRNHPGEIEDAGNVLFSPTTRHWIIPDKTDTYKTDDEVYIVDLMLNIRSDPVYEHSTYKIVNQNPYVSNECKEDLSEATEEYGRYAMELEEEMILPLVVQDVNHGMDYSDLRQVYTSLALAQWYKDEYWYRSGVFTDLIDSKDLAGLESKSAWSAEAIWRDYVKSFEDGEYHCWKNRTYEEGNYIITESLLYSSGGVDFTDIELTNIGAMPSNLRELTTEAIYAPFSSEGDNYYFGDGLYVFYPSSTPTTEVPTPKSAGFEGVGAVAGVLAVAFLIKRIRRRKK